MKKHLFLLFCTGICLVGCNQEETIKAPRDIQAETPQIENMEEKPFKIEERHSEGYKSSKEVVQSEEIKSVVEMIETAEWEENSKVGMELPPEYRFSLGAFTYAI